MFFFEFFVCNGTTDPQSHFICLSDIFPPASVGPHLFPIPILDLPRASSIVNTPSLCHRDLSYHMNSMHKWVQHGCSRVAWYHGVCVCVCVRVHVQACVWFMALCVSEGLVSPRVAPKMMSCGWDHIVPATQAVAMVLDSESCCFTTEGGKNTVQSDSSWKQPSFLVKPHTMTVLVYVCMCVNVYLLCVCALICVCVSVSPPWRQLR